MTGIGMYILDENGEPKLVDSLEWGMWFQTADRHVARTTITDGVEVSTVFLGLDHNWSGKGDPILWETMVFGGPDDELQVRYSSRKEAEEGHQKIVNQARQRLSVWNVDCPECLGTGEYVGITIKEDCKACKGSGKA